MSSLTIEGYAIISADGMLADASGVMPDSLKFDADQQFFMGALDKADLIVHERNSFENQPNSPGRTRLILTRTISDLASDPANPKATLWNPIGASFEDACARAGISNGVAAIIGGTSVFGMFLDRYDTFWLTEAPHVHLPGGVPVFPDIPGKTAPAILSAHGLVAQTSQMLDAKHDVTLTAWRRTR